MRDVEFFWISFFLSLMVTHVIGLQCYACNGDSNCQETEDCEEYQEQCSTTVMTILTRSKISSYFLKGCDVSGKPNSSISHLSGNQVVFLTEEHCGTELCNEGTLDVLDALTARGRQRSALHCYSCSSSDKNCFNASLAQMRCARPEEDCIDITAFTVPEEFPTDEQRIKGCGLLSHCQEPLGFHNQNSFYLIKCCNFSGCNDDRQDYKNTSLPLNGVTCHSCEGNATHGCSPDDITKVQCQGPMTQCLEASGIHGISGQSSVVKGCASPSWCDSSYTSVYKNLGALHSRCCTGELCNSWIINGTLRPSPRSRASDNTTVQRTLLSMGLLLSLTFLLSSGSS
ncbi:urokinase plasminogen activator surface receptor-like [Rhineura floridana]|uniref:urokinase plasminogen activator surface receptor-like n=1 Tax=Rhineura floridana TaxID=261503 RepID=UPI002AC85381|nr:urokinase plasminogen activator surface receptor-like [Rhineura floridana]